MCVYEVDYEFLSCGCSHPMHIAEIGAFSGDDGNEFAEAYINFYIINTLSLRDRIKAAFKCLIGSENISVGELVLDVKNNIQKKQVARIVPLLTNYFSRKMSDEQKRFYMESHCLMNPGSYSSIKICSNDLLSVVSEPIIHDFSGECIEGMSEITVYINPESNKLKVVKELLFSHRHFSDFELSNNQCIKLTAVLRRVFGHYT